MAIRMGIKSSRPGFTLVEIMVVIGILGLLLAIVIPNYVRARANAQASACINNLGKVEDAASQFALEKGLKSGDPINYPGDLTPYIKLNSAGSIPSCPAGGIYTIDTSSNKPQADCSLGSTVNPAHILP
jgi:prepilin-type N-terminal cleavage/methylation domain-containing protein